MSNLGSANDVLVVTTNANASQLDIGNITPSTGSYTVAYLKLVLFWNSLTPLGAVLSVRFRFGTTDLFVDLVEMGRGNDNTTARTAAFSVGFVFPSDCRPPITGNGATALHALVTFEDGQQFAANSIVAYLSAGLVQAS